MKLYNIETAKATALKLQYEALIMQVKNEQRELELKRRKDAMEL